MIPSAMGRPAPRLLKKKARNGSSGSISSAVMMVTTIPRPVMRWSWQVHRAGPLTVPAPTGHAGPQRFGRQPFQARARGMTAGRQGRQFWLLDKTELTVSLTLDEDDCLP
jgi:hypothetical protein